MTSLDDYLRALLFIPYARKSSESSERQIQSIPDQLDWASREEQQRGLTVLAPVTEDKSAKKPGIRPRFTNELLAPIVAGKANAILAWQLNRLSRNPADSGTLQWLLQSGVIKAIVTSHRVYLPEDNALLFSVESGMNTQFINDLRANTGRGMKAKLEAGWYPGIAPPGYRNDPNGIQGLRKIFVDDKRWDNMREAWELMLTGNYNPRQIQQLLNNKGFRTRNGKRLGKLNKLFTNIFYTGQFDFAGQRYQGKHRPMVTLAEFDRVQQILGARGRPRPQSREFAYTGLIRCGECDCLITAETKSKYVQSTGEIRDYTYYRCTKAKGSCTQKTIRLEALEQQIAAKLADISLHPAMLPLIERVLARRSTTDQTRQADQHKQSRRQLTRLEQELYDLQKAYTTGKLDDDFYEHEKQHLKQRIAQLQTQLAEPSQTVTDITELTRNVFLFAAHALHTYYGAPLRSKRALLAALGSNYQLKSGQLTYEPAAWFQAISTHRHQFIQQFQGVRTTAFADLQGNLGRFCQLLRIWCHLETEIRSALEEEVARTGYLQIPKLDDAPVDLLTLWQAHHQALNPPEIPHMLPRIYLSPDDIQRLITEYRHGATTDELATRHHICATSVKTLLRQHGVELRPRGHTTGTPWISPKQPAA